MKSQVVTETMAVGRPGITGLVDIAIVFAVAAAAFVLEHVVVERGWVPIGPDARGVTPAIAGAIAAVGVVLARGGTLADLGFRQPERWGVVPFQVVGVVAAFAIAQLLAPLLISLIVSVPEPDMSRYASLAGNAPAAIMMALLLPLTASIPEEIVYRGFLLGRFSDIFGREITGAVLAVAIQAVIFAAIHFRWGIGGMLMTSMMGLVWGTAYLLCGRNLWVVILAHSTGHILFVVQLYFQTPVAR